MSSKRTMLARAFDKLGMFELIRKTKGSHFLVLTYHRIYDGSLVTEFDEGVYAHSKTDFIAQMEWLKSNFDIITEQQLIDSIRTGKGFNRRTAMVTFDDGYLDNYEIAYPILSEMQVPATFFISCNHIEGVTFPWWDQIAYMIKRSNQESIEFSGITVEPKKTATELNAGINKVLSVFKNIPTREVNLSLKKLSEACKVEIPEDSTVTSQFMSWDQVQDVSKNGITIGSHSMNHRVLAQLPIEDQRWELQESKRLLEEKTGTPVRSVAYPVGGFSAFTQETMGLSEEAGYELGFSFLQGAYRKQVSERFQIRRVQLYQNPSMYKAQTLLPRLFLSVQRQP